jgi:predicted extracellular nuclease
VTNIQGILTYRYNQYRILLTRSPNITADNPRPEPLRQLPGNTRIVALNLYNYFNGQPVSTRVGATFALDFSKQTRGARNAKLFDAQTAKIMAAWALLSPDIVLLSELENDGPPLSALTSLLMALNKAFPKASWMAAHTLTETTSKYQGRTHNKKQDIRNAIIFNHKRVKTIGNTKTIRLSPRRPSNALLRTRHRDVVLQTFQLGPHLLRLGAIHLKSRSRCRGVETPCWNSARTHAISTLLQALTQEPSPAHTSPTSHTLLMGDFNALAHESPLTTLVKAGFTPLIDSKKAYSYRYRGEPLLLDHAMLRTAQNHPTSPRAQPRVELNAYTVKLSSDEGPFLHPTHKDYPLYRKLNDRPAGSGAQSKATPFRFSDHDPIVVDLTHRKPEVNSPQHDQIGAKPSKDGKRAN